MRSRWLDIGLVLSLTFYVEVDKNANKDRTILVNKGFIICPKRRVFLAGPTRKIPHLARRGSQSEYRIRLILSARGFSHIIKARLTPSGSSSEHPALKKLYNIFSGKISRFSKDDATTVRADLKTDLTAN